MGYAESKHVSERILETASERSGVPVCILRVGQIAGPVTARTATGAWNKDEWFPSMIKTSQTLGFLPNHMPGIDWIPVDILASAILDIVHFTLATATTEENNKTSVYNILNPQPTPWPSLINTVLSHLHPHNVQAIDLSAWIQLLEQIPHDDVQQLSANPAVKILDFYRACDKARGAAGVKYSTGRAVGASATMRGLMPVDEEWMGLWLERMVDGLDRV